MQQKQNDFEQKAVEAVRYLWHTYLITHSPEEFVGIFNGVAENMVLIGTGKDEFLENKESVIASISCDQQAAGDIAFDILDEWYRVQHVTDDVCVVYGTLWARERSRSGQTVVADMDTRFSFVCRNTPDGVLICHMHHSVPCIDQQPGEYYPKSITEMANEALERSRALESRLHHDSMTGLFNRGYAETYINQQLTAYPDQEFAFLMMDIDDFKRVNDQVGHLEGDHVLTAFAGICAGAFEAGFAARLGGDEFMVFVAGPVEDPSVARCAQKIIDGFRDFCGQKAKCPAVACSIGIAGFPKHGADFNTLYHNADKALYGAKRAGKGQLAFYAEG